MAAGGWFVLFNEERWNREKVTLDDLTDRACEKWCRMPKTNVTEICDLIGERLQGTRISALNVETQVIAALSVLASGSFQWIAGGNSGLSQSSTSTSRCLQNVTTAICDLKNQFIKFPTSPAHIVETKQRFYDISKIPNCLGAIDCTHVPVVSPAEHSEMYNNRYHRKSVNIQVICDATTEILDVVAKYPGSVHDSCIWRSSSLRKKFEDGIIADGWLIGDAGYPLEPWLLTPIHLDENTNGPHEYYNTAHKKARNPVERCFGILKGRWRCLARSSGELAYAPQKVLQMFMACAILHNYCVRRAVPFPNEWFVEEPQNTEYIDQQNEAAILVRNRIVDMLWRNRRNH